MQLTSPSWRAHYWSDLVKTLLKLQSLRQMSSMMACAREKPILIRAEAPCFYPNIVIDNKVDVSPFHC